MSVNQVIANVILFLFGVALALRLVWDAEHAAANLRRQMDYGIEVAEKYTESVMSPRARKLHWALIALFMAQPVAWLMVTAWLG